MRAADAALLIVALMIAWSLYRAHRNQDFVFNVFDILMENGRVSRLACVFLGSFLVSCWVMIRLTIDGKMTEGFFTAFGGIWVAPILAKLFAPVQANTSTSTTSVSTTTVP